jgi:hypothetical protein
MPIPMLPFWLLKTPERALVLSSWIPNLWSTAMPISESVILSRAPTLFARLQASRWYNLVFPNPWLLAPKAWVDRSIWADASIENSSHKQKIRLGFIKKD